LIFGADELAKGVVKIRNLGDRTESEVPSADVMSAVREFFTG
jgi:histidyl-tRNA synthetase